MKTLTYTASLAVLQLVKSMVCDDSYLGAHGIICKDLGADHPSLKVFNHPGVRHLSSTPS